MKRHEFEHTIRAAESELLAELARETYTRRDGITVAQKIRE